LKRQTFWVMAQQAGPGGWEWVSGPTKPGELRLWAYQSIAHGADAILFFRWRTARYGTEEYYHGILDHHGVPGRRYQEIQHMGAEIREIGALIHGSQIKAPVAFLLSYDSRFAFQIQGNNPRFSYPEHFHDLYQTFYHHHVLVDIVSPTSDLSNYRLVVAPALHVVNQEIVESLENYVRDGGNLVLSVRTGVKDEANAVVDLPLPGLLADLCGGELEEYVSLPIDIENEIQFTLPGLPTTPYIAKVWCDVFKPVAATVLACYTQDYFAGKPAITWNEVGEGRVMYLGTLGEESLYEAVVTWLLDQVGIETLLPAAREIEVTERWQGNRRFIFLLNHSGAHQEIDLAGRYIDLLRGGNLIKSNLLIPPREIYILEEIGEGS
jgi:beta-galactosidase